MENLRAESCFVQVMVIPRSQTSKNNKKTQLQPTKTNKTKKNPQKHTKKKKHQPSFKKSLLNFKLGIWRHLSF